MSSSTDEQRERLIEVAGQMLRESRLGDLALGDVAERARIPRRSIYRHFASKEELFAQVIGRISTDLTAQKQIIDSLHSPADRLRALLLVMLGFARAAPYILSDSGRVRPDAPHSSPESKESVKDMQADVRARLRRRSSDVVDSGELAGDPDHIVAFLVRSVAGFAAGFTRAEVIPGEVSDEEFADFVMAGLAHVFSPDAE